MVGHVARIGKKRCAYGVLVRKLREGVHLENLGVDGKIELKWIFKKCHGGLDWTDMAQYRNRCVAFVNEVMKLCFS